MRSIPLLILLLAVASCGEGGAPTDDGFVDPPDGTLHVRFLKDRDGASPGRRREALEPVFYPEAEGWRMHGHEIATPATATVRIDAGDRVDLRPEDDWPLADEGTSPPAWLLHVDVQALADTPFVVMSGHRPGEISTFRVVVVGEVDGVTAEGGSLAPRTDVPGMPPAFVIERTVPAASSPPYGNANAFSTARFGRDDAFVFLPFPTEAPVHLTSWVHVPTVGSTRSSTSNDLHSYESGDVRVASDGLNVSVRVGGREIDWTTYEHVLWTVRMSASPR